METRLDDEADAVPLEIKVCNVDGAAYGEQIGVVNKFNVYDNNGEIDYNRQRVYFETQGDDGAYIRVRSTDTGFSGRYAIRVFKARQCL